jgi:AP-2 complex subunit beta-1
MSTNAAEKRITFLVSLVYFTVPHPVAMFLPYAFDPARLQKPPNPQGKVAELRLELNSGGKKDKNFSAKKTALKKIVANMTMSNNDMVALFPDIVGCMHIPSLEIKKMCVVLHT